MTKEERLEDYMKRPYSVTLTALAEADGGGWLAETKELPGCFAVGGSREEALQNLEDAKRGWFEVALEEGFEVPEPRLNQDRWSGKLTLRIPKTLHAQLAELADEEGVSLNQLIVHLLSRGVGRETALKSGRPGREPSITISWADGRSLTIPESVWSLRGAKSPATVRVSAAKVAKEEAKSPLRYKQVARKATRRPDDE